MSIVSQFTNAAKKAETKKSEKKFTKDNPPLMHKLPKFKFWKQVAILVPGLILISVAAHYLVPTKALDKPPVSDDIKRFVQIQNVKKYYLLTTRADKQIELRTGGNLSWRLHNPGKLVHGAFTRSMGALGSDGKYAVFSTYNAGARALQDLLFESGQGYKELTVLGAMKKFASLEDGYKPKEYAKVMAKAVGVKVTTPMAKLTQEQQKKVVESVKMYELYKPGKIYLFKDQKDFKKNGW